MTDQASKPSFGFCRTLPNNRDHLTWTETLRRRRTIRRTPPQSMIPVRFLLCTWDFKFTFNLPCGKKGHQLRTRRPRTLVLLLGAFPTFALIVLMMTDLTITRGEGELPVSELCIPPDSSTSPAIPPDGRPQTVNPKRGWTRDRMMHIARRISRAATRKLGIFG